LISFQKVTKKYGKETALQDIDFTFEQGKIYGLVGANGSGKSTTLKMIAGLVQPTSGSVSVNGKKANRRIAADVSYLTELDMFYEGFTVLDMLHFSASQFQDLNMETAYELISYMALDKDKKIKELSKGNRGRLKLVISLSRKVPVLLLDEPFSGLDPMVRESIVKGLLHYIDFDRQTVIIATHEIAEIEPLLDDVVVINQGHFAAHFHVETLREQYGLSVVEWMRENINQL